MSLTLKSCCPVCGKTEKLLRCQACKAQCYCGKDHQVSHREEHKTVCNGVKKAHNFLQKTEQDLRAMPGDFMTPPGATIFEEYAGHFWGIHETRPYMRARYALVEALVKINTTQAVALARDHIMDMLRLCRGDNMGVRDLAPFLLLRLGEDQECYDFVKWWATTGQKPDYDWGDTDLPYLDIKNADVFEPVDIFASKYLSLSVSIAICLIKIRLLLDITALQNASLLGGKLPQEILDNIRSQMVSTIVKETKDIMESNDLAPLIEKLRSHIGKLHKAVKISNKYYWPALISPGNNLNARPEMYGHGSREQMQLVLQYSYKAWAETPGAIDVIKKLANGSWDSSS